MAAAATPKKTTGARPRAGSSSFPCLPVITVARFEAVAEMLEELVTAHTSVFINAQATYRDHHREGTSRPLNADEAAQVAAALAASMDIDGANVVELTERLQRSDLRAHDEPDVREVLLAAGAATAPAFIKAATRVVALIEMPADMFEEAYDSGQIEHAVTEAVVDLRGLSLPEARERASRALDHFAVNAGSPEGKGWRLLADTVWQALQTATTQFLETLPRSGQSSLTGSLASTDGDDESYDTASRHERPSN